MGLQRANIAKAVDSAFKALGNIPETVVLRRTTVSHETSTGVNTNTTKNYTIEKAIFTRYQITEIDKVFILATDVKMLIRQNELSITPTQVTDTIIRNEKTYNIIQVMEDPTASIYTLQLRAP